MLPIISRHFLIRQTVMATPVDWVKGLEPASAPPRGFLRTFSLNPQSLGTRGSQASSELLLLISL